MNKSPQDQAKSSAHQSPAAPADQPQNSRPKGPFHRKSPSSSAHRPTPHQSASTTQTSDLTQQIASLTADLQRTRADFENYRKQVDLQRTQAMNTARYATVSKVLPLLDDLDRAIAAHPELSPLQKNLEKTLTSLQLTKMDTTPGTDFNPDFHEAITMEEGDGDHEVIAETLRPGYLYEGTTLRPAMVKVKTA